MSESDTDWEPSPSLTDSEPMVYLLFLAFLVQVVIVRYNFDVSPPLDPREGGGDGSNTRLRVRGDPIRTTRQKAWHSVYSVEK